MEEWRDIKGYEGLYQVSNLGNVRSLGNDKTRKTKILKAGKSSNGYLQVVFCNDGKSKNYLVHRLVAEAFIPNPDNMPIINHKDCNPSNNIVFNLEWCDYHYNNSYPPTTQKRKKNARNGKLSKPVLQFDKQGKFIKEWPSMKEVERKLGFSQGNVSSCCSGRLKSTYDYVWKFAS